MFGFKNLLLHLKPNISHFQCRSFVRVPKRKDGEKHLGFQYFPRSKNHKDPPYTPTKLFLVQRIVTMRGSTKKEKDILARLNIDGYCSLGCHVNVVKNIPEINAMLWKVKHLVKIVPINFVHGLPKTEDDLYGCYLRDNGDFLVHHKIELEDRREATKEFENTLKTRMDPNTQSTILKSLWNKNWTHEIK